MKNSRTPLVAGNWKMNGSKVMAKNLLEAIKANLPQKVEVAVLPPFVFLNEAQELLKKSVISWGAQNLATEKDGAYTGEVSGEMLKEFACKYVLVGHSERRQYYGETNAIVAKKYQLAQESGLIPILCVGETLEERQAEKTLSVIQNQLMAVIERSGVNSLQNAIIAYEPIWAIGTGLSATPEQAQEIHLALRQLVAKHSADIAENLRILYGGSVKPSNAKALFAMPDIDGGLIGGASSDASDFINIYQSI